MDAIFRTTALPEVRQKYKQLGIERSAFRAETSQVLGAAYPEILEICDQISALCESAAGHEALLSRLSSVETLSEWRQNVVNSEQYHQKETAAARQQDVSDLVEWIKCQIERQVAEKALLAAARFYYLLSSLTTISSPVASLDECLDAWLLRSSDDLESIVAYILRYRVSPSKVAERLAANRLDQLRQLPVLDAVHLMHQTVASLDYIADYQLKFKGSPNNSKLVDVINVDRSALPTAALELPLYPECFSQRDTFEKSEFITNAEDSLLASMKEFTNSATATELTDLYGALARDCPQLVAKTHQLFVERFDQIIHDMVNHISELEIPTSLEQPHNLNLKDIDSIVLQVRGQCGSLEESIQAVYQWHSDLSDLKLHIDVVQALEPRIPEFKGVAQDLESKLNSRTHKSLQEVLERVSYCEHHGIATLLMQALDKETPLLIDQFQLLAKSLVSDWQLEKTSTKLGIFPSRGLLNSLSKLVDAMDNVAVGLIWTEEACKVLRQHALEKLEESFSSEMPFVYELFGEEIRDRDSDADTEKAGQETVEPPPHNHTSQEKYHLPEKAQETKKEAPESGKLQASEHDTKSVDETVAPQQYSSAVTRLRALLKPLAV